MDRHLIALAIYLLWQASTLGTIPREQFKGIIAGGSNVGTLVEYLHRSCVGFSERVAHHLLQPGGGQLLGVTLGLFDSWPTCTQVRLTASGRFKTALLTFVPPTIGGLLFLNGLIYLSVSPAGRGVLVVIAPGAEWAGLPQGRCPLFRAWGGTAAVLVLLFGGQRGRAHSGQPALDVGVLLSGTGHPRQGWSRAQRSPAGGLSASKLEGSSQRRNAPYRAGHSLSRQENQAVSRLRCLTNMCWRKVPS